MAQTTKSLQESNTKIQPSSHHFMQSTFGGDNKKFTPEIPLEIHHYFL
ncbi:MAG: hypothetical protein JNN25_10980 [Candidatus Kapabacteria bacterium]|nr:hypothetical protein [Candidatus Kapabacteria bacterium]